MKFIDYLKDKIIEIVLINLFVIITTLILYSLKCNGWIIFDIVFLIYIVEIISFTNDYIKRKRFYDKTLNLLENIDNKNLIHELIPETNFIDSKIIKEILYETNKYKIEEINKYKTKAKDFKEFIEMWVHEIKTPLSSALLTTYNNKSKLSDDIKIELDKIEAYLEQVLFYARSEVANKDYIVKKVSLETPVNKVILKHKQDFLLKQITLELKDLDILVNTDTKWLEYIIDQIITNSIKYMNEKPKIKIYTMQSKNDTKLIIEDNGIGITPNDLPRIFDKGFTGSNGRKNQTSTGIGLYLVKKLCDKLKHDIEIQSENGTKVIITFPIGSFTNEIK
ncbi:MAG: HAMP domain-containing histidine kinase [Bacilli bacterium]|nr:HAMP domain-containing histidine kinase [Bacilli bacterium]